MNMSDQLINMQIVKSQRGWDMTINSMLNTEQFAN